jgi:hypothetical protein
MEEIENVEDPVAQELERRGMPRCAVNEEASLLLLSDGSLVSCRIVELSLGGCRMEMRQRIPSGLRAPVEASFKINGIAFRLSGAIEWIAGKIAGISFGPMSLRRRDDLMEVLCEVEAAHAAEAERQARESGAVAEPEQPSEKLGPDPAEGRKPRLLDPVVKSTSHAGTELPQDKGTVSPGRPVLVTAPPATITEKPAGTPELTGRERRAAHRCDVDTSAVIHLVKIGAKLSGQILDLSLGGCRIRTAERFPVGIYTRVEMEFQLQGLPFRLAGVIQAIHGRDLVGIRFLDVSQRKREQVAELIDEIVEARGTADADQALPDGPQ